MRIANSAKTHSPVVAISSPVLTVIIPAYNEENLIAECLSSVLNQDIDLPYEVIVVEGPSTDNTALVAGSFPVKFIHLEQRGIGLAWKTAASLSESELLVFTEADTVVPKNWLRTIYNLMDSNPQSVGLAGVFIFKEKSRFANGLTQMAVYATDKVHQAWKGAIAFRGKNFAIRRRSLIACGGFDENLAAYGDVELSWRAQELGEILYAPSLLVQTSSRDIDGFVNLFKYLRRLLVAIYFIQVLHRPEEIEISTI
jgi:glycosyltransferase involved in cell wall biosynthesis